jgi:hypothetical protein
MTHYTIEDGLPSNTIYGISQDAKGFIWFATDRGVSQFDGHGFRNFSIEDGLPDNEVFSVREDSYQRLWLVSYNDQPAYIFNEKVYNTHNDPLCRTLGNLGVAYHTVVKTKEKHDIFLGKQSCFISKDKIRLIDTNKSMCLGLSERIFWQGHNYLIASFKIYPFDNEKLGKGIGLYCQAAILFHDKLYVHYGDSSHQYYLSRYRMIGADIVPELRIPIPFMVYTMAEFENRIICLTAKGIYQYDTANNHLSRLPQFPQQEPTIIFFIDNEKNIWVTSLTNGVYLYPNNKSNRYTITSGLKYNNVLSVSVQNGTIFAGYSDGSFDCISDKIVRNINVFKTGSVSTIKTVQYTGNNRFILGTDKGTYNLEQGRLMVIENSPHKNGILKNGHYLFGHSGGAVRYDIRNRNSKKIYNKRTTAIAEDMNGCFWFGTIEGVFFSERDSVRPFSTDSILLKSRITGLCTTSDNTVAIATHKDGLFVYRNKQLFRITTQQGLSSNACKKVLADHTNAIWLCTDNGLSRISIQNPAQPVIYTYSELDGLFTRNINDFSVDSNHVYIATSQGIILLPYQLERKIWNTPNIYIRTITLKDSTFSPVNEITLAHTENDLQVDYTAVSINGGKNIQYRYVLAGNNTDTSYTNLQAIKLSGLNPGRYCLFVWARIDKNSPWSIKPAAFRFNILAPVWRRPWFIVLVSSIILLTVFFLYRRSIVRIKFKSLQKSMQERRMGELEMQALRAQINPHFIFNALNSIQHYYAEHDERKANHYMNLFAQLIRRTLHYSKTHWLSLKEELETIETYISLERMRFKDAFEYVLILNNVIDTGQIQIPTMLLQPYIENAINHGIRLSDKKSGLALRLHITLEQKILVCKIEDDGIGISKALKYKRTGHNSMGMLINKQRIDTINLMYKTDISVSTTDKNKLDQNDSGTIITLHIPQPDTHDK